MELSGQLHASVAIPLGEELRYSLDRMLGESWDRSGLRGEDNLPIQFVTADFIDEVTLAHTLRDITWKELLVKLNIKS